MTRGIVADRPLSGCGGGRPQDGKYTGGDRRNFDRLWIRRSLGRLLLQEPIEESGVDLRCTKIGMVQDPTEQRNIRLNPTHKVFIERARQTEIPNYITRTARAGLPYPDSIQAACQRQYDNGHQHHRSGKHLGQRVLYVARSNR